MNTRIAVNRRVITAQQVQTQANSPSEQQVVQAANSSSPTIWVLLAYGGLALPLALAEIPIITYLPAFYARELHLGAGLLGIVFLAARLWDGVSDLLIGWLSDHSRSHWGRRKPWVLGAAPFVMGSLWFLCNPPKDAGLFYLVVCATAFYPAWTAMKIPYVSWGAELATDYVERSRITTFRESFMMLGNLLFAAAPIMFLAPGAPLNEVLFLISVTVLLLVPITATLLGVFVRDPVPAERTQTTFRSCFTLLARDPVLRRFILATLCIWTAEGVLNSLAVFSFGVGLGLPNKLYWIILLLYLSMLCAVPFTLHLCRHFAKHQLMAAGMAMYAIVVGGMLWVPAGNFVVAAAAWIVAGLGNAAIWALPTSVLADIIDRGEIVTGKRDSGAYTATYYLVIKIGLALGVGLSFGLLELVHYDPGAAHHSALDVHNIRLLGFVLPALFYVVGMFLYWKHPISKKSQQRLREEIKMRINPQATPREHSYP